MSFGSGEPTGQGVLAPCTAKITTIDGLITEASALWQAEDANARPGVLHKPWGCVGALFGQGAAHANLSANWTAHFQKVKAHCVSVVDANGLLGIGWPNAADGKSAGFDVILATATKPEVKPPTADVVADAWLAQKDGHERYFFENVRHGIRTPDDGEIWQRLKEKAPCWLEKKMGEYREAIRTLSAEAANVTQR